MQILFRDTSDTFKKEVLIQLFKYLRYLLMKAYIIQQAVKAGQNAFKQMKIALRSEDPLVLCKCWLFVAMSYMQQKRLNEARAIISTVFINVKSGHNDKTLIAMCKGIWARLQYVWNCT